MLKAFAEGLDARIDSVRDANGVRALEREIYGKVGLFAGHATLEGKLTAVIARCSQSCGVFVDNWPD